MAPTSSSPMPDEEPKPNDNHDAIKNWSQEEKYHLFNALKTYDRHDIEKIQEYVMSKTIAETKAAVDYYTSIAQQHPVFLKHQLASKPKRGRSSVPLTNWTKLLTDSLTQSDLRTETATAVRMIADLEKFPSPACTENIDFRQVYHQIADAMEGKPLNPDVGTIAVLQKCLLESALSSKAFLKTAAYKYVINNIDLSDKEINTFPRPTESNELEIIRHLASQRSYNPLKVPENLLLPSSSFSDINFFTGDM